VSTQGRENACNDTVVKGRSRKPVAVAREEKALSLRAKGYTEARIAKELGVTQQAVHQALVRALDKRKLLTDEELLRAKHEQTIILEHKIEEAVDAWEKSKRNAETERVVEKSLGKAAGEEEGQPHGGRLKRTRREPLEAGERADEESTGNWETVDLESIPGYFYDQETGEETLPEERAGIMATWLIEQMKLSEGDKSQAISRALAIMERTVTLTSKGQTGDPRYLELIRKLLADIRAIWGLDAPQKQQIMGDGKNPLVVTFADTLARTYGEEES
jgi:predicted transcriptional regulator